MLIISGVPMPQPCRLLEYNRLYHRPLLDSGQVTVEGSSARHTAASSLDSGTCLIVKQLAYCSDPPHPSFLPGRLDSKLSRPSRLNQQEIAPTQGVSTR